VFVFSSGSKVLALIELHSSISIRWQAWKYPARLSSPSNLAKFLELRVDPARRKELKRQFAEERFEQWIKSEATRNAGYMERGRMRLEDGDPQAAIEDFTRVLALSPKYEYAYIDRCRARRALGDLKGAIEDLDRAIAIRPCQEHFHARGLFLYESADHKEAIESFTQVLRIDRAAAWSYYGRGLARMATSAWDEAESDLTQALDLGPWNDKISSEVPRLLQEIKEKRNAASG
jgi:tetratricopeptide (TPR) repeat protein